MIGCPKRHISVDERELATNSLTVENCPRCGTTVRTTEDFSGMNPLGHPVVLRTRLSQKE
jgi:hypothetical protein